MVVSVDLAKKAGFAWIDDNGLYNVKEVTGDVDAQIDFCVSITSPGDIIVIEQFVYFAKSVKTQSSLLKRIGIFEYVMLNFGRSVEFLNLNSVRARYFKGKSKKQQVLQHFLQFNSELTDNHTDALLMLLYTHNTDISLITGDNLIINGT